MRLMIPAGATGRVAVLALTVIAGSSCGGSARRHEAAAVPPRAPAIARQAGTEAVSPDSVLGSYLRRTGLALDTVVARRGDLVAIIAHHDSADRSLRFLRVSSDGAVPLGALDSIEDFVPDTVAWFILQPSAAPAVYFAFDAPEESVAFAEIRALHGDSLARIFRDENACSAAALLPGDSGATRLVVYRPDAMFSPADSSCHAVCIAQLSDAADVYPSWPTVLAWTGSEWRDVSMSEQAYYRPLGAKFAKAADWLAHAGDRDVECHDALTADTLRAWSARAAALASAPSPSSP